MSRQSPISFNRQPLEKQKLEEKIKKDTQKFQGAGGVIHVVPPSDRRSGKLERWEHFLLPGSTRD